MELSRVGPPLRRGSGAVSPPRHQPWQGRRAQQRNFSLATDSILTLDATRCWTPRRYDRRRSLREPRIGGVALTIDGAGASYLARMQITEYRYVMNFERLALACLGIAFTIPGSASIWRRRALSEIELPKSNLCGGHRRHHLAFSGRVARRGCFARSRGHGLSSFIHGIGAARSRWIWGTIQAARFALLALIKNPARSHPTNALAFLAVTGSTSSVLS